MYIDKLLKKDKLLEFQYNRVQKNILDKEKRLYEYIDNFFFEYCNYHEIEEKFILESRSKFISRYSLDLKDFSQTGIYPHKLKKEKFILERIEYDIVLILSFLTEPYRFKIASWLASQNYNGDFLIIGCGPGVELGILNEFCGIIKNNFIVHDTNPSSFVEKKFNIKVNQNHFNKSIYLGQKFDNVLLIELLEHLNNPLKFLKEISTVLSKNSCVYLTTANDIPQFDHLYNFKIGQIKNILNSLSFNIKTYEIVKHSYLFSEVNASNELVVAKKN